MASRRFIKKCVKNLTYDLMSECIVYKHFHSDTDQTKTNEIMETLVKQHNDLIKKVNSPKATDERKKTKANYKEVVTGMKSMVTTLDTLE